jgi:hypothetical protein
MKIQQIVLRISGYAKMKGNHSNFRNWLNHQAIPNLSCSDAIVSNIGCETEFFDTYAKATILLHFEKIHLSNISFYGYSLSKRLSMQVKAFITIP